jgi:hypothetical protein
LKVDEAYALEARATSFGLDQQVDNVPDAWVMYESAVRDVAQALLAAKDERWSNLLTQMHWRNEALAKELRGMDKSERERTEEAN